MADKSMVVFLDGPEATKRLGRQLAGLLAASRLRLVLMAGAVGAGKTTLAAAIVSALPGGHLAEVCSPSFTLCNHYPTVPPVLHCDLYRDVSIPDELEETLENPTYLVLVEWAEKLSPANLPPVRLDILFKMGDSRRELVLTPHGEEAGRLVAWLAADLAV